MRGILNGSHSLDQLSDRTLFVKQAEQQPRHVPKPSSKVRITVDIETNTEAELDEKPSPNRSRVVKALQDIRISNARKNETRITQSVLKERIVALPFMENRSDSKDEYVIANHRVQKKGIRIIQNDFHEQADDVRKSRRAGLHEKTALLIDQYQKKQEPFPLETFARRNVKSVAKIGQKNQSLPGEGPNLNKDLEHLSPYESKAKPARAVRQKKSLRPREFALETSATVPNIRLEELPQQTDEKSAKSSRSKNELNFVEVYKKERKEPKPSDVQISGDYLDRSKHSPVLVSGRQVDTADVQMSLSQKGIVFRQEAQPKLSNKASYSKLDGSIAKWSMYKDRSPIEPFGERAGAKLANNNFAKTPRPAIQSTPQQLPLAKLPTTQAARHTSRNTHRNKTQDKSFSLANVLSAEFTPGGPKKTEGADRPEQPDRIENSEVFQKLSHDYWRNITANAKRVRFTNKGDASRIRKNLAHLTEQ